MLISKKRLTVDPRRPGMKLNLKSLFAALIFLVVSAPHSFADDGPVPLTADSARLEQLEREVRELREIVNRLVGENKSLKSSLTDVQQAAVPAFPATFSGEASVPKLEIHGFGHAQYDFSHSDHADVTKSDTNHFTNGGVDLFITSKLADQISFLNETVFEYGTNGTNILDVERVLLKYEMDDRFNVSIGRGHTALGYWNQRFHHGTWLYTTTGRPIIYRFEDDGGILPVHFVGLEFSGLLKTSGGNLSYTSHISNGRGTVTDEVQLIEDDNDSKMGSISLTYEPQAIEGLGIGANFLYDIIPDKAGTTDRGAEIDEIIYGTHAFYTRNPYELIMEAVVVDHYNHATTLKDLTVGGYGQIAYAIQKYKPYFRYDWLRIADRDPFFAGAVADETSYALGLRYDLSTYNALKFEYRHADKDNEQKNEFTAQSSFAF
jgi:hypothetical protein